MDNQQTPQAQPVQPPVQPMMNAPEPSVPVSPIPTSEPKKGGFGMWIIIIILVVVLLGAGGFYLYSLNKPAATNETTATQQTQEELNTLQSELESMDLDEIENDFTQIDRDLADL